MTNVDEEVLKKHGAKLSRIKERLNFHLKGSKKKKKKCQRRGQENNTSKQISVKFKTINTFIKLPGKNNNHLNNYLIPISVRLLNSSTRHKKSTCDPMDCSPLGSSVHGISRQEDWSGLPFPSPGDLPDPGVNPRLLRCRQILYQLSHQGIH